MVRESLLFQLKLLADGMRDFILVPISMIATLVGLIRSADDPGLEFNRVIDIGRKSEQWINLFGQHDPLEEAGDAGSIDKLVTRAEEVVREQVRKGDVSDSASTAIKKSLGSLHTQARKLAPGGADQEKP